MNKLPEACMHLQDRKETTNSNKRAQGATISTDTVT